MKKLLLLLTLLAWGVNFAQERSINDYKYVIIPEQFDFLKEANKYDLNMLTKKIFEKYGFEVYYPTDKLPDDLAFNKCDALYGDVISDSGLLVTGLYIVVKDCSGKELFRSEKGKSKLKDFKKAYYEALREASASLSSLNYEYSGKSAAVAASELKAAPMQKEEPKAAVAATQNPVAEKPVPVVNENQLFAQPIANGYQLVDMTPKVVLKMYRTSQPDNYTAQGEGKNGVVFKKGNEWFFEYYQNDKLVSEKLNIKF